MLIIDSKETSCVDGLNHNLDEEIVVTSNTQLATALDGDDFRDSIQSGASDSNLSVKDPVMHYLTDPSPHCSTSSVGQQFRPSTSSAPAHTNNVISFANGNYTHMFIYALH